MVSRDGGGVCARVARRRRGKQCVVLALLGVLLVGARPCPGAEGADSGVSTREARATASRAIPWDSLRAADLQAVRAVVGDPTLYRRLPTRIADCDPEFFEFLVDNPELVVEVWGLLGISRLRLERIGPNEFRAMDGTGTAGVVRIVHRSRTEGGSLRVVALAEGVYEAAPMPSAVTATCVLAMTAAATTEANGRTYVTTDCDSFMRLDKPVAELVLKTLHPLVVRTADHNFTETVRFASLFSRTAQRNPDGMERLAGKLTAVDERRRGEFVALCRQTADRESQRLASRYGGVAPAVAIVPTDSVRR
jgi:hypothetical protein